jgi:hypothetical protein
VRVPVTVVKLQGDCHHGYAGEFHASLICSTGDGSIEAGAASDTAASREAARGEATRREVSGRETTSSEAAPGAPPDGDGAVAERAVPAET